MSKPSSRKQKKTGAATARAAAISEAQLTPNTPEGAGGEDKSRRSATSAARRAERHQRREAERRNEALAPVVEAPEDPVDDEDAGRKPAAVDDGREPAAEASLKPAADNYEFPTRDQVLAAMDGGGVDTAAVVSRLRSYFDITQVRPRSSAQVFGPIATQECGAMYGALQKWPNDPKKRIAWFKEHIPPGTSVDAHHREICTEARGTEEQIAEVSAGLYRYVRYRYCSL